MVPAFLLAMAAFMPFFVAADSASAASGQRITLGKTSKKLEPNCGKKENDRLCVAEGRVTGYQVFAKGSNQKRSFNVPFKGKIVSWSISLANPTRKTTAATGDAQLPFFNLYFGSPSQARISVLRQVQKRKKGPPRYKMVRQSPTQTLNPYFGSTVHFALTNPLNVIKDQVVALTIPTWAPAYWRPRACDPSEFGGLIDENACADYGEEFTWRGSRGPNKCLLGGDTVEETHKSVDGSHPQQKVNSIKRYACYYKASRLLYTATIVGK
ncbi:MAG: hypothetical protein ACSLFI_03585 [Solirubrobacterales bacterium]